MRTFLLSSRIAFLLAPRPEHATGPTLIAHQTATRRTLCVFSLLAFALDKASVRALQLPSFASAAHNSQSLSLNTGPVSQSLGTRRLYYFVVCLRVEACPRVAFSIFAIAPVRSDEALLVAIADNCLLPCVVVFVESVSRDSRAIRLRGNSPRPFKREGIY